MLPGTILWPVDSTGHISVQLHGGAVVCLMLQFKSQSILSSAATQHIRRKLIAVDYEMCSSVWAFMFASRSAFALNVLW